MSASVIALAIGDAHMSHDVPIARAETRPEWYEAMARVWTQIRTIKKEYDAIYVFAPGDIFHRWNEPHELITLLNNIMIDVDAVPGNHDLVDHDPEQIYRTAYWTMRQIGRIRHLAGGWSNNKQRIKGFGFGSEVLPTRRDDKLNIAVIHDMIWNKQTAHKGVEESKNIVNWISKLGTYDVAVFGDNHKTLVTQSLNKSLKAMPSIVNCGTLMRRRSDERNHKPCVAVIYDDASIKLEYLDCTQDKWREDIDSVVEAMNESPDASEEVMETLRALSDTAIDFIDTVRRCAEKTKNKRTRSLLIRYAEEVENAR